MNGDEEWKRMRDRSADVMERMLSPLSSDDTLVQKAGEFIQRLRAITTEAEYKRFNIFCRERNLEYLKALANFEFN